MGCMVTFLRSHCRACLLFWRAVQLASCVTDIPHNSVRLFVCVPSAAPESPWWKVTSGLSCWSDARHCPVWFQLTYLPQSCWLSRARASGCCSAWVLYFICTCSVFKSVWSTNATGLDSCVCDQTAPMYEFNPILCSHSQFAVKPLLTDI